MLLFPTVLFGWGIMSILNVRTAPLDAVWEELRSAPGFFLGAIMGWIGILLVFAGCLGMYIQLRRGSWCHWIPPAPSSPQDRPGRSQAPVGFLVMSVMIVGSSVFVWLIVPLPTRVLAIRPDRWWEWAIAPATVAALPIAGGVSVLVVGLVLHSCIGHLTADDLDEGQGRRS